MPHDRPRRTMRRRTLSSIAVGLVAALLVVACSRGGGDNGPTPSGLPSGIAPESARVDLAKPRFSDPTSITNPLFPVADITQAIQLGVDEGKPLRVEYTRLPGTKIIDVNGRQIETVVALFIAYHDRRIKEVTPDYFAQADDGSVWYLGEDVDNYEDGVIADHEGTWLAGKDGPPAMIMPAEPEVGDVYRPENIPGLVFEEVTVKSIDQMLAGPRGAVEGAAIVEELHIEGDTEFKAFAPGYGEFLTPGENLALAVPIDALSGRPPAELQALSTGAGDIFDAAPSRGWSAISAALDAMTVAWKAYQARDLPPLLEPQMTDALDALATAVKARSPADARQAALDVTQAALDFQLQYRPVPEVDLSRIDLWARQLLVDAAAAADQGAAAGDVAILETIWKRVGHAVTASGARRIHTRLAELRAAVDAQDLTAASDNAEVLRDTLANLRAR